MPKFKCILEFQIKAKTQDEANDAAGAAAVHLRETFNDDDSISPGIRYMSGGPVNVIVSAEVLAALISAVEFAAGQQDDEAERNRKDCQREAARACTARAGAWRRVMRAAQRGLRGALKNGQSQAEVLAAALREVAAHGPDKAPESEDYDDTESAYGNGQDVAAWEAAQIARTALKAARV